MADDIARRTQQIVGSSRPLCATSAVKRVVVVAAIAFPRVPTRSRSKGRSFGKEVVVSVVDEVVACLQSCQLQGTWLMDSTSSVDGGGLRVHGGLASLPVAVAVALVTLGAVVTVAAADDQRAGRSGRRRVAGALKVLDPGRLRGEVLAARRREGGDDRARVG